MKTGYVVFAHGSRLEEANESVRAAASRMARDGGYELVDVAFLDCAPPDLSTTIGKLVDRGAGRVVVIPYFLTAGRHTSRDLPRIVEEASRIHKVRIDVTETLDGHPALGSILLQRARQS
ncbi:MAG: CbiX/SirB N-terminal domain-containing protein [Bryobacteraceae bacterium]|nr:CbiX/SirB N-terminal domain-containing protein [Bryobacteraceae bacterium]